MFNGAVVLWNGGAQDIIRFYSLLLRVEPYTYMEDLLKINSCTAAYPIQLPAPMGDITTPLRWQEWDRALENHPDQRFRTYIVDGIKNGFRVGYNYEEVNQLCSSPANMASAMQHPEVIREYLAKECSEGRVLGPLDPTQFPYVHTSRFGAIPKGSTGKWRLIVDLSSPEGRSVNDGIEKALSSLSYIGVEEAAEGIRLLGRGSLLAKVDVKSAFRNIPVHPDDRWMMGMTWDGGLFIDTTLPFGLRSAPKIFSAVADAVEWAARHEGVRFVIHYLDDFLVIGTPNTSECAAALKKLLNLFHRLGLPVAVEKRELSWNSWDSK